MLLTKILESQCTNLSTTVHLTFENACLVFVDAVLEAQVCRAHRFFEAHPRTKILESQRRNTFAIENKIATENHLESTFRECARLFLPVLPMWSLILNINSQKSVSQYILLCE
jgi:hypothetical protein